LLQLDLNLFKFIENLKSQSSTQIQLLVLTMQAC